MALFGEGEVLALNFGGAGGLGDAEGFIVGGWGAVCVEGSGGVEVAAGSRGASGSMSVYVCDARVAGFVVAYRMWRCEGVDAIAEAGIPQREGGRTE
jgi:hypothetical protein